MMRRGMDLRDIMIFFVLFDRRIWSCGELIVLKM